MDATVVAIVADRTHAVVRLEAEPATLRERIAEREPDGWPGLDDLLAASARLVAFSGRCTVLRQALAECVPVGCLGVRSA